LKIDIFIYLWYNISIVLNEKVIVVANLSNKSIVDRCVDILSTQFRMTLRNSYQNNGLNYNGNVDFSGLSEQLMAELENGNTTNIESIINRFVGEKIQNFDKAAGEIASKRGGLDKHRNIVNDLIGLGKNLNGKCADAIINNVTIEKTEVTLDDDKASTFRQGLSNFKSENEGQPGAISMEEALQKNAQQLYERTGEVPNGYALGEDGQVFREAREDEQQPVNQRTDVEMEK